MINGAGRQLGSPQPSKPNDTLHRDTSDPDHTGLGHIFSDTVNIFDGHGNSVLLLTSCCCWAGCMLSRLGVPGLKEISCVPSRPSSSACQLPPGRSRVRDRRLQRNTTFIECCNTTTCRVQQFRH